MKKRFRIHGDNIVECERISDLIIRFLSPSKITRVLSSLACINIELDFIYNDKNYEWNIELLPGFNKNTNDRWKTNILDLLTQQGSFLDETPDALLTKIDDAKEEILVAVEFCSALQAGNQAWQRSGRAYSTGRTECSYLYIVDFVKYELDTRTRERKALRYPNAAVPYSYISHSKNHNNFIAQAYFRAEEFQPDFDENLSGFDTDIFSERDIAEYLVIKMMGSSTAEVEKKILDKNIKMVNFLANKAKTGSNFTPSEWDEIYSNGHDVLDYCVKKNRFKFKKKIAEKSISGKVRLFNLLVQQYSIGLASEDLPFGIISKINRDKFVDGITKLYQISDQGLINSLKSKKDLIVCMLKGFKPGGDDNRPDRGALPLISMLAGETVEILTFVYGPILASNLETLNSDINKLAKKNGLWQSFVGLSDFIILDAPLKENNSKQITRIMNNIDNKKKYLKRSDIRNIVMISNIPNQYQENDVDTIIHVIFKYIVSNCFEGMCNPPGGDWSGLSVIYNDDEYRWLSLPRVSSDCKRPDHVIEIFNLFDRPVILSIESKETANDLELNVGIQLKRYLEYLFDFVPSTVRKQHDEWKISNKKLKYKDYLLFSVGAYIDTGNINSNLILERSKCDMLFALKPIPEKNEWVITMHANKENGKIVIDYLKSSVHACKYFNNIKIEGK